MVCIWPVRSVLARTGGIGLTAGAVSGFDGTVDWLRAEAATVLAVRERKERRCMGTPKKGLNTGPDGWVSIANFARFEAVTAGVHELPQSLPTRHEMLIGTHRLPL